MRSKTALVLMELVIMLLVFSLASGLCLKLFSASDRISRDSARLDRAVTDAQNAAEALKAYHGDFSTAANLVGGSWDGYYWTISYDTYTVTVSPVDPDSPTLGRAALTVTASDGETIFDFPIAWQKEVETNE